MEQAVPLSWQRIEGAAPCYQDYPLPFSGCRWVAFADLPHTFSFPRLYEHLTSEFPQGFLIRGCPPSLGEFFASRSHESLRTGAEALLDLADNRHFSSRRLRACYNRGWRHGSVEEVRLEGGNLRRFQALRAGSSNAGKPQLRNLFRSEPFSGARCFVFRSLQGEWLAGLLLSQRGRAAFHAELLLRHRSAPGDIMECLVAAVGERLHGEGAREFSLGEVPFMLDEAGGEAASPLESMMFAAASRCRHAYDYQGLYRFKNKFRPIWRPVRLCAGPGVRLTLLTLAELSLAMGFVELLAARTLGWKGDAVR